MFRVTVPISLLMAILVCGLCLAACGNSTSSNSPAALRTGATPTTTPVTSAPGPLPADAVAEVGTTVITKSALDHWIAASNGQDFYENAAVTPPKGMLASYASCAKGLKIVQARHLSKQKPTKVDPVSTCRELTSAVKQQTLTALIESQWLIGQAAELGVTVSSPEVNREFKRVRTEQFPTTTELKSFLVGRDWTLGDELHYIKQRTLSAKLLEKFSKSGVSESAYETYLRQASNKWVSMTRCRAGYVVQGCSAYRKTTSAPGPSPLSLIRKIMGY